MVRVTNSVASHKRKKRLFKQAKGFYGDRKNHVRLTKDAVMKAMAYNYRHRKDKKRNFRSLWITRLNAATKINGLSYSKFVNGLKKIGCTLNRKVLSELAIHDPKAFSALVDNARKALTV